MDVIEATRELGRALQADPRYSKMQEISAICDKDEQLQADIGQFNLIRMNLTQESEHKVRDELKIQQLNTQLQGAYDKAMSNPHMAAYNAARQELDALLQRVSGIISNCADGEDPATTEPAACTHDCSSCGGCH